MSPNQNNPGINPYNVLGISTNASPEEIRSAYRRLAKNTHPDHGGTDAKFRQVQEAWELLSDSARRATFDTGTTGIKIQEQTAPELHKPSKRPSRYPANYPWKSAMGAMGVVASDIPFLTGLIDAYGKKANVAIRNPEVAIKAGLPNVNWKIEYGENDELRIYKNVGAWENGKDEFVLVTNSEGESRLPRGFADYVGVLQDVAVNYLNDPDAEGYYQDSNSPGARVRYSATEAQVNGKPWTFHDYSADILRRHLLPKCGAIAGYANWNGIWGDQDKYVESGHEPTQYKYRVGNEPYVDLDFNDPSGDDLHLLLNRYMTRPGLRELITVEGKPPTYREGPRAGGFETNVNS